MTTSMPNFWKWNIWRPEINIEYDWLKLSVHWLKFHASKSRMSCFFAGICLFQCYDIGNCLFYIFYRSRWTSLLMKWRRTLTEKLCQKFLLRLPIDLHKWDICMLSCDKFCCDLTLFFVYYTSIWSDSKSAVQLA